MKDLCGISRKVLSSVLLFAALGLAAQTAPTNGPIVHMLVSVEAHHGENVPTIQREDVMVYEGRDRDRVVDWVPAQGDHAGLDLVILLDDGSNISLGSKLEDIRQFIFAQPSTTSIAIAYMRDGMSQIVQSFTTDHQQAAKALRLPLGIAGVNGSPYFSLTDLIKRWPANNNRKEVLMVTDGIDRYYGTNDLQDPYVEESVADAQRARVLVFAIYSPGVGHFGHSYWSTYWGQLYLARVAEETGGESYYIGMTGAPVSFVPYLDDLTHRLGHQYFLSFMAKPQKRTELQKVKLSTEVPNAELVAAGKVLVPASQ